MHAASPLPPPRIRADWPGAASAPQKSDAEAAAVARQFEALIVQSLLRSARAANLGDDGLGAGGDPVRDLQDRQRAEAIAAAAPLGVARLLARAR